MNGFGWSGRGGRGGVGRGTGLGRSAVQAQPLQGYSYVGGCRCGFGPNAYYQDASGQLLPAAALYASGAQQQPADDIERLKAEKADLERRLQALEARLQGNS